MSTANKIWKGLTIVPMRLAQQGLRTTWLWLVEKAVRVFGGMSPAQTSRVADRLWVGGQHYKHGLSRMETCGIGATLSLREEADDNHSGVAFKRHLWLPTPDDDAPTVEQIGQGVAFIQKALADEMEVYIHCGQGVGRAPTMAAAYLVSRGKTPIEAMQLIRQVRPFITPTPVQLKRLEEWAETMNKTAHTPPVSDGRGRKRGGTGETLSNEPVG